MKKLVDNGERVNCMSSSHVSVKEMFNAVKSVGVDVLRRSYNKEDSNELWQSGRQCRCLCITLQSSLFSAMGNFSTWIVDDSSQLSNIDLFFRAQHVAAKRVVFVGDYKQNTTVNVSYSVDANIVSLHHSSAMMITDQYRMTPEIGNFVGNCLHENKLISRTKPAKGDCLELVPVAGRTRSTGPGKYVNESEIEVLDTLQKRAESYGYQLTVLCMYQSAAHQAKQRLPGLKILTVDSAQGKTIGSVAILLTNLNSFTQKTHRMNVAISRARHQCFIVYRARQAFNVFFSLRNFKPHELSPILFS